MSCQIGQILGTNWFALLWAMVKINQGAYYSIVIAMKFLEIPNVSDNSRRKKRKRIILAMEVIVENQWGYYKKVIDVCHLMWCWIPVLVYSEMNNFQHITKYEPHN